jgi:ABC-type phosphate transport system permease subunit
MDKTFHQSQISFAPAYGGFLFLICTGFLIFGWFVYFIGVALAAMRFKSDHVFHFLLKQQSKTLVNILIATTILTLVAPVIAFYATIPLVVFIAEVAIPVGTIVVAIIVGYIHSEETLLNHGWVKI